MDVKKINKICYDQRVQYVRKRFREVVLVRCWLWLRIWNLDCGEASPGFGASPNLTFRFWSLIELLSVITTMLGFFLFPLGLGAWTSEGRLLVLGLLLVYHWGSGLSLDSCPWLRVCLVFVCFPWVWELGLRRGFCWSLIEVLVSHWMRCWLWLRVS